MVRGFKKYHSNEITLHKPDNLDCGRGRMTNEHVVSNHFTTLGKLLEENDLLNKPECIFNIDESGMSMSYKNAKVVVKKGAKQARSKAKDQRDHITINCCVSANGQTIPPFIIYEKAFPSAPYKSEGIANALHGKSENGYMDTEDILSIFYHQYMVLNLKCKTKRPLKTWQISQENTCVGFIKKRPKLWCFPVKFAKYLRIPILKNINEQLLLNLLLLLSCGGIFCYQLQSSFEKKTFSSIVYTIVHLEKF